ncbi:MAG: SixA phosphatase family protein [Gammaproteobacteria bacterium]
MRQLYLVRHADAVFEQAQGDHQRALSEEGLRQAAIAGQFLQKKHVAPVIILHSDALRTTMTAQIIADNLQPQPPLVANSALYNAPLEKWEDVIFQQDKDINIIVAVGHNMGISRFANFLSDDELLEMHNCSIYGFQFDVNSWQAIGKGSGRLILQFHL